MSLPRLLVGGNIGPDAEVRILIRLCDSKIGARRIDSGDRIAEIVVLDQRGPDQFLQLFIIENLEPFEVTNGLRVRSRRDRRDREITRES